ncbi:HNH endonuclease signature motif containing protein [Nocardia sp. NBC_00416]|uniref:HNH endonuclease signature motif containing protein n=1 Tax=Nocardia sp. NBC_00416 TaxID=2975991 RepID=UPI002E213931
MHSGGWGEGGETTGALHTTVTRLTTLPLTALSDDEVLAAIREVERCARLLTSVQHRLLVEASERALPARLGAKSLKNFLMQTLRLAGADAGARVHQAAWVATFHDMAGYPVPPRLPHTAKALAEGEISADHARGIASVVNRVPRGATHQDREAAEQILAEFARSGSPDDIGRIGDRILAYLDPDGRLTTNTDRARMRGITLGRQRPDGMSPIRGEIDPVLRALLDPVLAKYARPGMCNPDDPAGPQVDADRADPAAPADATARDHRTPAQRNHDALKTLLHSGVIADRLGTHRGVPVATILTMKVDDLENASGVATTATGGTVPLRDALALAERSQPWLAVFDHAGMPLHLGRVKRLASPAQRLALIAALKGCSRPGCNAPASLCAVHHVLEYRRNGTTDVTNLTLACDSCHALIHDGPGGWKTKTEGPRSPYAGRTVWIAPQHIDPEGIPRINHRHRAGELLAETLLRIHAREEHARQGHRRWLRTHAPPAPTAA